MKLRFVPAAAAMASTIFTGSLVVAPVLFTPAPAMAQNSTGVVGALQQGLVNVNVQNVQVDKVVVVNVTDVLNHSLNGVNVNVLRNFLNNNTVASNNSNFLNNLLQKADIIKNNQVVVGVLNGAVPVIFTANKNGNGKG